MPRQSSPVANNAMVLSAFGSPRGDSSLSSELFGIQVVPGPADATLCFNVFFPALPCLFFSLFFRSRGFGIDETGG